jgi:hypothetical protein
MDRWTIVAVAGAFLLGCAVTFIAMRPPRSYEQCVVDNMRGQSRSLSGAVDDLCRLRFPAPKASVSDPMPKKSVDEFMKDALGIK